ncbi:RNA polymerase II transcription factor B subunit 2 [Hyphopichia burtonii NRRL Y-1933]|uniref:RNA polymerase II transcription factor B subunit 2 n=1 Tax=Hyphopichia burtonii NRRL Y-1933 TaxID=984485 RepID=A0A1E4RMV5_9ASCO|nr:RNA polymerase II transcription factor B subunit 2 [Hyphopichia burtonii NRRL Y-1933]ODV68521.1 RNA polymerase II transcription factor B subunit 2 [Hyphopichia burtonii NRRL Y-1933]
MSSSTLFKATVNEHLENLPKPIQSKLYEAPATCLSIYRLLPPMAKFFIMSMLFHDKPVAYKDLERICKPNTKKLQFEAFNRLKALHLIDEDQGRSHLKLHPIFKQNFRDCLTGSQASNAFGNLCTTADKHQVDVKFLDQFASQKWETILHFMVGTELGVDPSKSVLSLLKLGGLMEGPGTSPRNLKITNEGFQFLLQDVNAQIWTFLLQYLNLTQDLNMDPVDVLNFIFILGSLELGKSYTVSSLSATQVSMLADLKDYGLIYQRSDSSSRFYPTRLATTLTSESAALRSPSAAMEHALQSTTTAEGGDDASAIQNSVSAGIASAQGTVIIETNFKIYAYTNSPLEIAVLNLFVNLKIRFSNMVCGQITRESIRHALLNGITADQIIRFLETHAHPQMRLLAKEKLDKKIEFDTSHNINTAGGAPQSQVYGENGTVAQHKLEVLPPTVVDQIKLWQLELDRIQTFEGYLFKDFQNQQEYDYLSNYAQEIGVLIWGDKVKKKFFVTPEGMDQVAIFANRK